MKESKNKHLKTSELIRLLTHSTPDSRDEKKVLRELEHRIEQNNQIPLEFLEEAKKSKKIYNKFHNNEYLTKDENIALTQYKTIDRKIRNKEKLDDNEVKINKAMRYEFYDLNEMVHETSGPSRTPMVKNDSLITAAARYGHSKVVDLLVNKGGVDILSTRYTGNYSKKKEGYEEISALSYLREYQKKILPQRKIDGIIKPIVILANVISVIGRAIASIIPGKKSTGTEKSSVEIAKELISAGDAALRNRAESNPELVSRVVLATGPTRPRADTAPSRLEGGNNLLISNVQSPQSPSHSPQSSSHRPIGNSRRV